MAISTQALKKAVKEALIEQNEGGIQPIVFPPLEKQLIQDNTAILTQDVVDSLLRHKRYKRVKEGTIETYEKHLHRFAREFPVLPLEEIAGTASK